MIHLFPTLDALLQQWRSAFPQQRTFQRARRLTYGLLFCQQRHLTSAAICATGQQFQDWSADYRVASRSRWHPHHLFQPVIAQSLPWLPPRPAPVLVALDDTLCKKTGRHIPGVSTARDPQSPPYHVNLLRGLRFVQASLLIAPSASAGPARALPVRFQPAPAARKPNPKAPPEAWNEYRQQKKALALPAVGLATVSGLRREFDQYPQTQSRPLLISVDGSYTNQVLLKQLPPRTILIGRIRKDAKLSLPLNPDLPAKGRPRQYGPPAPTPKQVLDDEALPTQQIPCFAAGKAQSLKVKTLARVFWRKAGPDKPLQLVVIKPLGYRLRKGSKLLYREPAFLICTDPHLDLPALIQAYVYRWEIEVNHRDEKSFIGVAQGQVRNPQAAARLPQWQVAAYSLLLLASLQAYGFQRTADYLPLPKWRQKSIRPSILDLLNLLRAEILGLSCGQARPQTFDHFDASTLTPTNPPKPQPQTEGARKIAA